VKRPTMLVEAILRQAEVDLDLSVERDVSTLRHRCKHEGLPFLTITLPTLSDALERGLESGRFSCPSSFSRHGSLPRFMGGFFNRVFTLDGELRDDACPDCVYFIRQISRFFKKLFIECLPKYNRKAVQHFVDVETELKDATSQMEKPDEYLDKVSGILWSQVFPEIDPLDLICHHGPGATAERLRSNDRHHIRSWNTRSELLFPSDLHCYPNYSVAVRVSGIGKELDVHEGPNFLHIRDELPVRVVFVPKTQLTPRVIAIEPSHVQYMQQSVKDYVYKVLETHALTKESIRFTRQDFNQKLARKGSIDKRTSTLDLKDASDRVHLHLVQRIFKTSGLLEYLEDARSLHALLPDGRNIVLSKYASMGSALCFPVEAMVFYTLVQCAMHQLDGRRPSSRSILNYSRKIDIYGDDIIIPVEYTDAVVNILESYALKVNVNKSFSKGNFRESCGADYFKGTPVNPVYARRVPHDDSRDWGPSEVMSWTATSDLFYMRGKWIVAEAIRKMVSQVVRRTIPKTRVIGSGIAFFSFLFTTDLRYDRDLQCWKQKRLQYQPTKKKDSIDGNELACLNKWGQHVAARSGGFYSGYAGGDPLISQRILVRTEAEALLQPGQQSVSCECRVEQSTPGVDAWVDQSRLCDLSVSLQDDEDESSLLTRLAEGSNSGGESPACLEYDFSADYCLTEEVQSDPLSFLDGRVDGLDFETSVKRGCFKSKSRWVTLAE